MNKINWTVRLKNKQFVLSLVSAMILCAQGLFNAFGFNYDTTRFSAGLIVALNALFTVLTLLGVTQDPTTSGYGDSDRAMTYKEPG